MVGGMPVGVAGILEAGETQGSVRDRECGWQCTRKEYQSIDKPSRPDIRHSFLFLSTDNGDDTMVAVRE